MRQFGSSACAFDMLSLRCQYFSRQIVFLFYQNLVQTFIQLQHPAHHTGDTIVSSVKFYFRHKAHSTYKTMRWNRQSDRYTHRHYWHTAQVNELLIACLTQGSCTPKSHVYYITSLISLILRVVRVLRRAAAVAVVDSGHSVCLCHHTDDPVLHLSVPVSP